MFLEFKRIAWKERMAKPSGFVTLGRQIVAAAFITFLILTGAVAADQYRLAPGDVLRVLVVGEPELSVDVAIEMDGSAWFPMVGVITAEGATLSEVRRRAAKVYSTMSLNRALLPDGSLSPVIETSQVYVTVATYRPIFIVGDVIGAREIPFRMGLTLRHLLALVSTVPQRSGVQPAALAEIEAAATALAHEYAQIWQYKAFLGIDTPADYEKIFVSQGKDIDEIVSVERSILTETLAGIEAQKQAIRDEIGRIETRAEVLSRQKDNESEGLAMDEQDLANVNDLFSRGLVPASRLTDVRRSALVTASRVFQIDVAFENTRGQVASSKADIVKIDGDARVRAWKSLGEAVARVQERRSDYETLIANSGGNLPTRLRPTESDVVITRNGTNLPASETTLSLAMMPGDFVEIYQMPQKSGFATLLREYKK